MLRTSLTRTAALLRSVLQDAYEDERGDVPGWVLITLMTAGLPLESHTERTRTTGDSEGVLRVTADPCYG